MENKLLIPVLLGTAREGRQSEKAAIYVSEQLIAAGFDAPLVDVRDYAVGVTTPPWIPSEAFASWKELMGRADGLVIVSPEYNHGYPGELKIMLDSLMAEYARKPVGICGVSSGGFGGVRVVEQLRLIAINFQMVPLKAAVQFSNIETFESAKYDESVKKFCEELQWMATALKSAR
jgi:NAD(P)H-dependent FMN reductase